MAAGSVGSGLDNGAEALILPARKREERSFQPNGSGRRSVAANDEAAGNASGRHESERKRESPERERQLRSAGLTDHRSPQRRAL